MDEADSDFLHHLFKENNELRARYNGLQRELNNKTIQLDNAIEDLRLLRMKREDETKQPLKTKDRMSLALSLSTEDTSSGHNAGKQAASTNILEGVDENTLFVLEAQKEELARLTEDLAKTSKSLSEEKEKNLKLVKLNAELEEEVTELRKFEEETLEQLEIQRQKEAEREKIPEDLQEYRNKLRDAQVMEETLKKRLIDLASEANKVHNVQQNQLQGVETMVDRIRREYEEFIHVTKLENESFRSRQQAEYEKLKKDFEQFKNASFEEKKNITIDYQNILSAMQAQFDEYRATTEFLFNAEMVKLDEEITSQATRYEQEIMYVIQAKDKFYSDMMVAKDAKIMGLIEGSDLQAIMQKHEMDVENMRKEHQKEIERVKSEHDSESKNVIMLLQRQNVSLESKTEKIQAHLKTMEAHMKDLMATIEIKNKTIAERDENRQRSDAEFQKQLHEASERIAQLTQEKEHLRHKVIRLNLNARGEGENSVENMLKRLTRDTTYLQSEFNELATKYENILTDNQDLNRKLRDKDKSIEFLEIEIRRRALEYAEMTQTFEEFLAGRAKQAKRERQQRLEKLAAAAEKEKQSKEPKGPNIIKAIVPEKTESKPTEKREPQTNELQRGMVYLKRFKNLSRAFQTGEFRASANVEAVQESMPGPWQKTPLYNKLEAARTQIAKLYTVADTKLEKPPVYQKHAHPPQIKMYYDKGVEEVKKQDNELKNFMVGNKKS